MRKRHTLSEGGVIFANYAKKTRFPRVEVADFPNNSLNFHEKRTHSLNVHEKHTCLEKGYKVCELYEKDTRFPRVEFIDFLKIGPRT